MELAVLALLQLIQRRAHHRVRRILQPAHHARACVQQGRLKSATVVQSAQTKIKKRVAQ